MLFFTTLVGIRIYRDVTWWYVGKRGRSLGVAETTGLGKRTITQPKLSLATQHTLSVYRRITYEVFHAYIDQLIV